MAWRWIILKLASLFVDIEARDAQFQSKLAGMRGQLGAFGAATAVAVGNLSSAAILGATRAVAGFFSEGVKGAVDLATSTSRLQAIFGESSGVIQKEAEAMASKFGVVKTEFLDAAGSFGAAFKAAGSNQADAAALGNKLAKLGMDLAAFGKGSNEEVFTAMQAALRGEFDPLERFGVMLSAAKVENEALALGLAKTKSELDDSAKKQATLSLFMKGTVDQQGALERNANTTANSWRRLTGTITNLSTAIGTTLEPALNSIVGLVNEMALGVVAGAERADGAFAAFAAGVKAGVDEVGVVWRNFGDIWEMTTISIGGSLGNAWAVVSAFGANVVQIAGYLAKNWYSLITDALAATTTSFQNFADNVSTNMRTFWDKIFDPEAAGEFQWKPLLTGFQAVADALPEIIRPAFVDVQDQIDAVQDRMVDREGKRLDALAAKKKAAADGFIGPPKPTEAGAGKKDTFKSELVGTADFTNKIRASIFGGDDTPKQALKVQQEQLEVQKEQLVEAKKNKPGRLG